MASTRRSEKIRRQRLEHKWGMAFPLIYRELRVVRGLDLDATAEVCGISRTTLWRWLRESERENTQAASATTDAA